ACFADLVDRHILPDKTSHMKHGLHAEVLGDAERYNGVGMAVHHGLDVRPATVDFAMDEALKIDLATVGIHRIPIQGELDDILSAHTAWRHIAGKQETVRPSVMTDADMSETIDNALVEKDMVGCYQILDQLWGWRRTRL